ncbi:hypothetical protein ABZ312_09705 [Streptomyces sp. NPDC006207]
MDATTALTKLTARANGAFAKAESARKALTDALTIPGSPVDGLMDAVLAADGQAKPWRELMVRIERHGVRDGLDRQRAEALEALLHYGFSMSTGQVTNAARHHEDMGLRRFINVTDGMDIEAGAPATA